METNPDLDPLKDPALLELARSALKAKHPIAFFKPHAGQVPFHTSKAHTRYFSGANQSGKTTSGLADVLAFMMGYRPWLPEGHPDRELPVPVPNTGRVMCQDYKTTLKETILPKLEELAPEGFIQYETDGQGNKVRWVGSNGSIVNVLSFESSPRKFESGTFHWAFSDEPPPIWAYLGTIRGLIKHNGYFWAAGTAIVEPWVFEEIYAKAKRIWMSGHLAEERPDGDEDIEVTVVDIWDNAEEKGGGLPAASIKRFESRLSEKDLAIRARGLFPQVGGRVVSHWKDRSPFVIDPCKITHNSWGLYAAIDPHPRKPSCIEWIWMGPDGTATSVGELYRKDLNTVPLVCEAVLEFESGFGMNAVSRQMDGKMGNQADQGTGLTINQLYAEHGVYSRLCNIPPEVRLLQIKEWTRPIAPENLPRWRVFRTCARLREELSLARWEDWTARTAHTKPDKETIDKKWDDAITCAGMIFGSRPTGFAPVGSFKHSPKRPKDTGSGAHTGY